MIWKKKINICICGGGSQGHISAGVIGSHNNAKVNILTRRPALWTRDFKTVDPTEKSITPLCIKYRTIPLKSFPMQISSLYVFPGYAIREELEKIKPYVSDNTIVGCAFGGSGFFLQLFDILGSNTKGFAFQRVPFTGRPKEYGHSATLKGYKPYLKNRHTQCRRSAPTGRYISELVFNSRIYLGHWL